MMTNVNTVTGQISSEDLGKTLMHEHFQFGYPGFYADFTLGEYRPEAAIQAGVQAANNIKTHGVKTVVDPTPNECGRDPLYLKEVSEKSGVQIICTTGYYYEAEGAPAYFKWRFGLTEDREKEVYDMMMTEVTKGIGKTGIKAGAIKVASSKDQITDYEKVFFKAAARVQRDTGVPIITHTQEGTMGPEQAKLLISEGANPKNIMIGHMCGNTDYDYHVKTLDYGVNIGFDRFGVQGYVGTPSDEDRLVVLYKLLENGYANKILLSHDTVNFFLGREVVWPDDLKEQLKNYHPTHIFENIIPELLAHGVTQETIDQMLVENTKHIFEK